MERSQALTTCGPLWSLSTTLVLAVTRPEAWVRSREARPEFGPCAPAVILAGAFADQPWVRSSKVSS